MKLMSSAVYARQRKPDFNTTIAALMSAPTDDILNLFPKSSGPPGPVSSSVEMYIRRRVAQEVTKALAPPDTLPEWARPNEQATAGRHALPPVPSPPRTPSLPMEYMNTPLPRAPPPPSPLLTLTEGSGPTSQSIQVHDEGLANRLIERLVSSRVPAPRDTRSRSPILRPCPPLPRRRQAVKNEQPALQDQPTTSTQLAVVVASSDQYVLPDGPELPAPSDQWVCIQPSSGSELWVKFLETSQVMDRPDVQHLLWSQFYCVKTVAGLNLHGFNPTDVTKEGKKQWHDFERLLLHYRSAIMRDANRIKSAVEVDIPVLQAGPLDLQEKWIASILAGADHHARFSWSDAYGPFLMGPAVKAQVQSLARTLSSIPGLRPFGRMDLSTGKGSYWLFPGSTDPDTGMTESGAHEAPLGVFLIMTTTLPDDAGTCFSVPFVHNTIPQDLASVVSQQVIRPSFFDRADRTWVPSTGFYGRLTWPKSAIRIPKLDGSQPEHLTSMRMSMLGARRFGGKEGDTRTCAAVGWTFVRQHTHCKAANASDQTFGHMWDLVHGQDGRWMFRSSRSILTATAVFWSSWARET